jgi:hypothetical protein
MLPAAAGAQQPAETPASGEAPVDREEAIRHLRYALEQLERAAAQGGVQPAGEAPAQAGAGGAAPAAPADVEALRRRLEALERQLEQSRERTEQVGEEVQAATTALEQEIAPRLTLSGYSDTYLRARKGEDPTFRGFRVNLLGNAQITQSFRFFLEIELEDAREVGKEGGGVVEAEQAFMELTLHRAFAVAAGIQLVPFGHFNWYHEDWRWSFTDRPLVNNSVFPSTYADVGITAQGRPVAVQDVQIEYRIGVFNGLGSGVATLGQGGTALRGARPVFEKDNNSGKSIVGRVGFLLGTAVEIGASGYWGPYTDDGQANVWMVGGELKLDLGRLMLRAEGVFAGVDQDPVPWDDDEDPATPDVEDPRISSALGGVVEGELRFWPAALSETPLGKPFDDPTFFLGARADLVRWNFPGDSDPTQMQLSGSFGYRPIRRSAIRFEFTQGFALRDGGVGFGDDNAFTIGFAIGY